MIPSYKLKELLSTQFEVELLEASIYNLKDKSNKLRLNNFAYSLRELSRHFLYSLSPEAQVKNCDWYKPETDDNKPTRNQRIKYAIQGGINDIILDEWGFEVEELNETITQIKKTIENLSKYTHINPEVFNLADVEIDISAEETLKTFEKFVEVINDCRIRLKEFLDGHIEQHMMESAVSNFFENIDHLAPHFSINYSEVNDYHISEINSLEIVVELSGILHVTLEYGSSKERREGDGLDLEESFPFVTKIKYEISEEFPSNKFEIDDYDVDTSSWYE
jgi:hypothetical protein